MWYLKARKRHKGKHVAKITSAGLLGRMLVQ
jgi:hypothetical protein